MGEQIGTAVEATLYHAGLGEFQRLRAHNAASARARVATYADLLRLNTLYMIAKAGSGHIGSSFSSMDIVSWLYLEEMREQDIYFSSKGHDAPGLYAILLSLGRLPFEKIHLLRRAGGLPGHPDVAIPGMVVNSGSLGMGISKAKGMVRADRLDGRKRHIFVMTGDGELQEGQIWESLVSAANDRMDELTVIVDHNKLQSDYLVARTSDLGDLEAKFRSFGWHVERVDGHDLPAFAETLKRVRAVVGKPQIIIADTIKGCGISFMEHVAMESDAAMYRFHSGAPDSGSYTRAAQELIDRINASFKTLGLTPLVLESTPAQPARPSPKVERMVPAYGAALLAAARKNERIVALDADLILDTGLIPFRDALPDRFVECGIAEQDMVSQAGGLALAGRLPVVHSFACFLAPRANEQIATNATEGTQVIYVGSLAGVLPGGPGHSHQAVRDISAVGSVPGMLAAEPCCEAEVEPLLQSLLARRGAPSYLRLVSIPCEIPYHLPAGFKTVHGRGHVLRDGKDGVVIG